MRGLLGAIQFLTVLPVRVSQVEVGRTAVFFPLVGAAIGWIGAGGFLLLQPWLGTAAAALLVIVFWSILTGAIHEDGLADVADAFRAHRSPERIAGILIDPRIGTFGALALLFSVLLRWHALQNLTTPLLPSLVAAQAVPRAAMVVLGYIARPVGSGLGARFCNEMTAPIALAAAAQGVAAALWCGLRPGIVILAATGLLISLSRSFFDRRLGGVTGDCLGATAQLLEIAILLLLACQKCSW